MSKLTRGKTKEIEQSPKQTMIKADIVEKVKIFIPLIKYLSGYQALWTLWTVYDVTWKYPLEGPGGVFTASWGMFHLKDSSEAVHNNIKFTSLMVHSEFMFIGLYFIFMLAYSFF